ncbi:MAG: SDR family NAD(P)-dependent oxidoreductase [Deltaproteobacteria bacterium]|nr:SDR family NAD(P)-dependent oxidoreductase [Deltaproteobacteria bacterium]
MNIVMLGATRGMGRALSRLFAARGDRLFLLGNIAEDLQQSVVDLQTRGSTEVASAPCDLLDADTFRPALEAAERALGRMDVVVVSAGLFAPQEQLEEDYAFTARMLQANFTNTVLFCEQARERILAAGGGTLCVFSSVAGDRGRKPVVLYGASKAGLSHYLESLDHRYRQEGLVTVCVKPGFVKTTMTAGLKPPPFAGEPEAVAEDVLRAIDRGSPVVYVPPVWSQIMRVIRALPRAVMRKVNF